MLRKVNIRPEKKKPVPKDSVVVEFVEQIDTERLQ